MRRRYRQINGKLVEIAPSSGPSYGGNTFQVGDLPDIMKDVERHKAENAKLNKAQRLQIIIDAVNRLS